jgi:DNA-binding beta-propeller fold protein YncE
MRRPGTLWWAIAAIGITAAFLVGVVAGPHLVGRTAPGDSPARLALDSSVAATCSVGIDPTVSGYDPVNHEMYVPNEFSGTVSVLRGNCTHIGTVKLHSSPAPWQAAFDPANNLMYVTDSNGTHVYVLSGLSVVATIGGFFHPDGIVYDPGDQSIVVTNEETDNVSFVQGTAIISSFPVGCGPQGIAYNPYFGTLLVANICSSNVTVLNAIYPAHITDVSVGNGPSQIVFDPADSLDYVTCFGADNVTVLDGMGGVVATFTGIIAPNAIAWSQSDLRVFVDADYNKIYEISGTSITKTFTAKKGSYLCYGMAYNDNDDEMYVSIEGNGAGYVEIIH